MTINNTSTGTAPSGFGTLNNTSLTNLTLSGTGPIRIGTPEGWLGVFGTAGNAGSSLGGLTVTPTVFNITNTNTSATTALITTLTDNNVSALTYSGTGSLNITTMSSTIATTGITNNSTGTLTIGNTAVPYSGLSDTSLTSLTLAGTGNITINEVSLNAVAFTIIDSDSATVSIPSIGGRTQAAQTYMNTGTGTMTVGSTFNDARTLTTLTLVGNVAYSTTNVLTLTADAASGATTLQVASTMPLVNGMVVSTNGSMITGTTSTAISGGQTVNVVTGLNGDYANAAGFGTQFTLSAGTTAALSSGAQIQFDAGAVALATVTGASDNANVNINTGVDATALTLTLGNGNNTITDLATASNITMTFGTGQNTVVMSGGSARNTAKSQNVIDTVTFGTHTGGSDTVTVGPDFLSNSTNTGAGNLVVIAQNIIAGSFVAGDTINFSAFSTTSSVAPTTQASGPINGTLATVLASVEQSTAANTLAAFTYGTNTYLVLESSANAAAAGTTTVVQIVGSHTFGPMVNGSVTLLT